MARSRMGWSIVLIGLMAAFLFLDSYAALYLMVITATVILCSILAALYGSSNIDASISMPGSLRKRDSARGEIRLKLQRNRILLRMKINVVIKNILTGEEDFHQIAVASEGRREITIPFTLQNELCGCIEVRVCKLTIYDMFGIYRKTLDVNSDARINVFPDTFHMDVKLMPGRIEDSESIEYSCEKPGDDRSETFGIREYQQGDDIRNIHWKLTGKCDDLMIKMPSLPLENSVLLLLETSNSGVTDKKSYIYDAMAEIYVTAGQTLINNDIAYRTAWYDHENSRMFVFDIENEDDFYNAAAKMLCTPHKEDAENTCDHYITEFGEFDKAHIMYITPENNSALSQIPVEIRQTVIVCTYEKKEFTGEDVTLHFCSPDNYMHVMKYLEI